MQTFFIPFKQLLYTILNLDLVDPTERVELRHIDEFAHGAVRFAGIKLHRSLKAFGLDDQFGEFTDGQFLARSHLDVAVAYLAY